MSVSGISGADFDISRLLQSSGPSPASSKGVAASAGQDARSFLTSLSLRIAEIKTETFATLMSSSHDSRSGQSSTDFAALFGGGTGSANPGTALFNASAMTPAASGRNSALFDPEAAYRMMTVINAKDAGYKAEFSAMSDMKSYLATLQEEGSKLGRIDSSATSDDIHARLKTFADAYNGWIERFDQDLEPGGMLAGTQAAQVSQWELERSVENFFTGAKDGLHGMRDLGFSIDPMTNLASVDSARLDSALAGKPTGVIATLREFSANFAKSAALLNSDGNFIANRLDNLDRVIDYVASNKSSLQTEFGLGDAAQPTGQVAQALASYNSIHGLTG